MIAQDIFKMVADDIKDDPEEGWALNERNNRNERDNRADRAKRT